MTTYDTYQEAKIANPDCEIHKHCVNDEFATREESFKRPRDFLLAECNPADCCMTVEKFLADGYKFVEGDTALIHNGDVKVVENPNLDWNIPDSRDNERYVLRAAALEGEPKPFLQTGEEFEHTKTLNFIYERLIEVHGENPNFDYMHKLKNAIMMVEDRESPCNKAATQDKPKRTKVEYAKCEDKFAWQLVKEFEEGVEFYTCSKGFHTSKNIGNLISVWRDGNLHRCIETPMTWKEELYNYLDNSCEMSYDFDDSFTIEIEGRPLEFNLNDDEFVDMCKLVASLNSVN